VEYNLTAIFIVLSLRLLLGMPPACNYGACKFVVVYEHNVCIWLLITNVIAAASNLVHCLKVLIFSVDVHTQNWTCL